MDHMSRRVRHIWAAVVAGFLSTLVIPAAAWADQTGVADVVKRRGVSFGGVFGLLCCLVVIGVIALVVFLIIKSQRKK